MPIPIFRPTPAMQKAFRHPRYAVYASQTTDGVLELHTILLGATPKDVQGFLAALLESGHYKAVKSRKFPATGDIPKTLAK
jgi:hypothetical protein